MFHFGGLVKGAHIPMRIVLVWQCSVKIVERLLDAFRNAVDFSETFNGVEIQGEFNGMRTTDRIIALHGHVHTPTSSAVSSTGVLSVCNPIYHIH